MKIYLDGEFVEKDEAKISVFDHGLLYGDGIFEGIRIYQNCVYRLDEHLERLEYSAKAIVLDMPWTRDELSELVCESCRVNGLSDGYIRLIVTRGPGSLGLSPSSCPKPSLIIIADKIALYPEECYTEGLKIVTVPTRRTNSAALNPGVKSLNYLNNVMAKVEAAQAGALEAIMLNDQGNVAECTGDNLFIVHKGVIFTPHASNGALRGITRQAVMDIATSQGYEVKEVNLTRYEIWNADECFLTGTAAELIPVVGLDSRKIGTGSPGPVTKKLHAAFHEEVSTHGTLI
ncbi:branched-chain-amino-acid transaminase [Pelagicoccus mobilis]|uniref:Branched-chain-amino-acid aminotransferase n=1 Tax=Pelagicoccus mobilis TaxID=415221 RepID=A0A934RXJ8_9BACT|nr:branched-chain-amino-acid transaminase [Pelagicoccus mobilis]MBK1875403.1 branched-chain-amino-acid transaminase [Pelagicoccus mobilis]